MIPKNMTELIFTFYDSSSVNFEKYGTKNDPITSCKG